MPPLGCKLVKGDQKGHTLGLMGWITCNIHVEVPEHMQLRLWLCQVNYQSVCKWEYSHRFDRCVIWTLNVYLVPLPIDLLDLQTKLIHCLELMLPFGVAWHFYILEKDSVTFPLVLNIMSRGSTLRQSYTIIMFEIFFPTFNFATTFKLSPYKESWYLFYPLKSLIIRILQSARIIFSLPQCQ